MAGRITPRTITQDSDQPIIASFSGLEDASTSVAGDIIKAHKLVNAFVNKSGELEVRAGTTTRLGLLWNNSGTDEQVFAFQFDRVRYVIMKVGNQLILFNIEGSGNYNALVSKSNVFRPMSDAEPSTMTQVVEGNTCYILIATRSTQLIAFVILARQATVETFPTPTTITTTIKGYPSGNQLSTSNSAVFKDNGALEIKATTVTQSSGGITVTAPSSELITLGVGSQLKVHMYFWCRCVDANFYPGLTLWGTAARRNSVALDVNVQVPTDLVENQLLNEPQTYKLDADILTAIKFTTVPPTYFTRVYSFQPSTEDTYEYSDGGYTAASGNRVVRSPAFLAFGALQAGGLASRVYIARARKILVGGGTPNISSIDCFLDKQFYGVNYRDANLGYIGAGAATFFSATANSGGVTPGINGSSVLELIFKDNAAGSGASWVTVNIEPVDDVITIADGNIIPLYGYNQFADTLRQQFPNQVYSLGNRVVLAGLDNVVCVSDANWSYRGISWNNFQVSSFNFTDNSAYRVRLGMGASTVNALFSVNGVIIAATDVGVFRISGDSQTKSPSATIANVSRVSSEIVNNGQCFSLYDNEVFYCSRNGVYSLQYGRESDELTNKAWSSEVNRWFNSGTASAMAYSLANRSLLVSFSDKSSVLALNVDSQAWSEIKFATSLPPVLNQTYDGIYFKSTTTEPGFTKATIVVDFNRAALKDFEGLAGWFLGSLPGVSATITHQPTNVDLFSLPAEMFPTLSPTNLRTAFGGNHVRTILTNSLTVVEASSVLQPRDIIASFVSKAFYGDKLFRVSRLRAFNVVTRGVGLVTILPFIGCSDFDDLDLTFTNYIIGSSTEYNGEDMLNAEYITRRSNTDICNLQTRTRGINENFQLCIRFTKGLQIVGFQLDTSRKGLKRTK